MCSKGKRAGKVLSVEVTGRRVLSVSKKSRKDIFSKSNTVERCSRLKKKKREREKERNLCPKDTFKNVVVILQLLVVFLRFVCSY